jgi:hypothetical protein
MQHDITKLCADSLRVYLNSNHGIKLKSGHAHEIVAAFFGYKSRIAMLADKKHPTSNLDQAEFILLDPPTSFVDQRLKGLEGLSPDLPPSYIVAEGVYSAITGDKELLEKIQPSFRDLAIFFAEERLHQQLKMLGMNPKAINWIVDVAMQDSDAEVLMTVSFDYHTGAGERHRYSKYAIHLPRIAANLGYGMPRINETRYSGETRKYSDEELLKKYPISAVIV